MSFFKFQQLCGFLVVAMLGAATAETAAQAADWVRRNPSSLPPALPLDPLMIGS